MKLLGSNFKGQGRSKSFLACKPVPHLVSIVQPGKVCMFQEKKNIPPIFREKFEAQDYWQGANRLMTVRLQLKEKNQWLPVGYVHLEGVLLFFLGNDLLSCRRRNTHRKVSLSFRDCDTQTFYVFDHFWV